MQVNVIGILDKLFSSNAVGKESGVSAKGASAKAVQDTVEIGNNRSVIRSGMNGEKKKAGIYDGETPEENEFANQLAAIKQQLDAMINEMSGDDYAALHAEGISITSSDMERLVTVVDEIKIRLAAYCDDYNPVGGISKEDLESVLGSAGMAAAVSRKLEGYDLPTTDENVSEISEAMQRNNSLTEVTREQAAYLAVNDLEPTIENVYKVQHSGIAVTAAAEPLTDTDWEQLKKQVENIIIGSGAEVTEENLETARWMIEHEIALDKKNFTAICTYTGLGGLKEGELLDSVLSAMAKGKTAEQTSLLGERYRAETVTEAFEQIEEYVETKYPIEDTSIQAITARRRLEEIRLMMTVEAGLRLLRAGVEINTEDLERLVEELKKQEQSYYQKLYAAENLEWTQERADLVKQTESCRQELSQMPIYLSGEMMAASESEGIQITMQNSLEVGYKQKASLEAAGQSYETLMTKPNSEYGDSIKKAFRNVDAILEEMGEALTEQNERCIRILAYNQMELTVANLNEIRALDEEYQYLLTNLTPRVTMHMIQKRINPLNMEIHDLNDRIEEIKREIGPSEDEKYSEFLWKLEQKTGLSNEERSAYIGVYRLLNTINRQDSASLGALVSQGGEVTLEHLLSASQSRKVKDIDVIVDDAFGVAQKVFKDDNIADQLKLFYEESAEDNKNYQKHIVDNLKELRADTKAQQLLAESEQTVSVDSLKAAGVLVGESDTELKKYWEKQKKQGRVEEFLERMTGKDSLSTVFEEAETDLSKELEEECTEGVTTYSELEELRLYYHTAQLMTNLSRQEEYHIPLEYQGEITDVHLKVVHKEQKGGRVSVETNLPGLGKVMAKFAIRNGKVTGFILGESVKVTAAIESKKPAMAQAFGSAGMQIGQISCRTSEDLPVVSSVKEINAETSEVTTAQLYDVAKTFLVTLKNIENAK